MSEYGDAMDRDELKDLRKQVTQQAATIRTLMNALKWMSGNRSLTIFIEEESHVASFFERCDAALAIIRAEELRASLKSASDEVAKWPAAKREAADATCDGDTENP